MSPHISREISATLSKTPNTF